MDENRIQPVRTSEDGRLQYYYSREERLARTSSLRNPPREGFFKRYRNLLILLLNLVLILLAFLIVMLFGPRENRNLAGYEFTPKTFFYNGDYLVSLTVRSVTDLPLDGLFTIRPELKSLISDGESPVFQELLPGPGEGKTYHFTYSPGAAPESREKLILHVFVNDDELVVTSDITGE